MKHDKLSVTELTNIFWIKILYAIGSFVMNTKEKFDNNMQNMFLTKLFCGYIILYTIAVIYIDARETA